MKRLVSLVASKVFFILFLITVFFIYFFAFSMLKAGIDVYQPFDCTKWEQAKNPQVIVFGIGADYYKMIDFKFAPYSLNEGASVFICRRYYLESTGKTLWQTRLTKEGNEASLLMDDNTYFIDNNAYTTWKLAEVLEDGNKKVIIIQVGVRDFEDARLIKEQTFKIKIEPYIFKENKTPSRGF